MAKALIGAGCFWGVEEYFRKINGINKTRVGYSGGDYANPTYEDVCYKNTGHAEVVLLEFEKNQISFDDILNHFWQCHDPTQLNRQGLDIGKQYRSVIFFYSKEQQDIAKNSKLKFEKIINKKIVTEINQVKEFFLAEEYHQCFLKKRA